MCNQEKMHRLSFTSCCVRHLLHHVNPLLNWPQTQQRLINRTIGAYVTAVKMQKLLAIPTSYKLNCLVRSSWKNYYLSQIFILVLRSFPRSFSYHGGNCGRSRLSCDTRRHQTTHQKTYKHAVCSITSYTSAGPVWRLHIPDEWHGSVISCHGHKLSYNVLKGKGNAPSWCLTVQCSG